MSYLDLARAALANREKSEESPRQQPSSESEKSSDCEKSERSEKSPVANEITSFLTPDEAEALKARIIAVVTVDPAVFDRALYEGLTAEWKAHEATLASHDGELGAA